MQFRSICNDFFDTMARSEMHILSTSWPAFKVCGYLGLTFAIVLGTALTLFQGLSLWVLSGLVLVAIGTFLGLAMATKIVTGEEQLIYYHHEIAIMLASLLMLWMLNKPVAPYLTVTILGIGTFLTFGRVGCMMVGCCHGRPCPFGICYREEHAQAGFPHYYVGVRLFPIQAVESLWVLGIVAAGVTMVAGHNPPAAALAWYIVSYDTGRFFFEFMRGDASRPYLLGFSEAQWTSVLLMVVVVWLEFCGAIPHEHWHNAATAAVILVMAGVAINRRFQKMPKHLLLRPGHVREIARALELPTNLVLGRVVGKNVNEQTVNILVGSTSLGLRISAGQLAGGSTRIQHYALSFQNANMSEEAAKIVAEVICKIKRLCGSHELLRGGHNVYHLLIRQTSS